MPEKKIFFVYSYDMPYIRQDIELLEKHYEIIEGRFLNNLRKFSSLSKTISELKKGIKQCDLVFVWFADARAFLSIILAWFFHKPVIVVIGGYEVTSIPAMNYGGMRNPFSRFKVKFILKNAAQLIAVSDFSASEIRQQIKKEKIETIPLSIKFINEVYSKKKKLILTVGRATKDKYRLKGLDRFAQIAAKMKGFTFVIVGEYEQNIKKELLKICKKMKFTGELTNEQLLGWYKKSKVFCQLSLRESFGYALLEAMNYGCIPVVSNNGALPEVIGNSGLIIPSEDISESVDTIKRALKWNTDIPRQHVKLHFDLSIREKKLCEVIDRFI